MSLLNQPVTSVGSTSPNNNNDRSLSGPLVKSLGKPTIPIPDSLGGTPNSLAVGTTNPNIDPAKTGQGSQPPTPSGYEAYFKYIAANTIRSPVPLPNGTPAVPQAAVQAPQPMVKTTNAGGDEKCDKCKFEHAADKKPSASTTVAKSDKPVESQETTDSDSYELKSKLLGNLRSEEAPVESPQTPNSKPSELESKSGDLRPEEASAESPKTPSSSPWKLESNFGELTSRGLQVQDARNLYPNKLSSKFKYAGDPRSEGAKPAEDDTGTTTTPTEAPQSDPSTDPSVN